MKPKPITRLLHNVLTALAVAFALAMPAAATANSDNYTEKLTRYPVFPGDRLLWVGKTPPSEAESEQLWDAFGIGRYKYFDQKVPGIEAFINTHPNSPWTPSLEAHMGVFYRENGYFTLALNDWQAAWNSTHMMTDFKGREVADFALVNWLRLLSSLGRTDTMKQIFDATKNRRIRPQYAGLYSEFHAAYDVMLDHPELSYRCGTYALDAVARAVSGKDYFKQIWEQPSPPAGFSMADLVTFASSNHLNMVAVDRPAGRDLVVPSVVHWKQNHYAAIIGNKGDFYEVIDPTFRMNRWLKADAINSECSGQFIVPAGKLPDGWRTLTSAEAANIVGKGFPQIWYPAPCAGDGGSGSGSGGSCPAPMCGPGPGCQGSGGGSGGGGGSHGSGGCSACMHPAQSIGAMPTWSVMEPWCNLIVQDEPLAYQPSKGPRMSFKYYYWSNGLEFDNWSYWYYWPGDAVFGISRNWTFSWFSYVVDGDWNQNGPVSGVELYAPDGGMRDYTNFDGTVPQFSSNTRMLIDTNSSGDTLGYTLIYPSGAEDVYTNYYNPSGLATYFLSKQIDKTGQSTTFIYTNDADGDFLLLYVIDADGNTNMLTYTNVVGQDENGDPDTIARNVLSTIKDPFGHVVHFSYDTNYNVDYYDGIANLTNVTDPSGLSSFFGYDQTYGDNGSYQLTRMSTPYGTTMFYQSNFNQNADNPMTIVTEPNDSHQMFLFIGGDALDNTPNKYAAAIPTVYTDPHYVPTNRPNDWNGSNTLDNPDWNNPGTNGSLGDKMQWANSFYWDRQQFANLSSAFQSTWDPNQMKTNDFNLARLRHWNETTDNGIMNNLSMERDPSPDDGYTLGEMTWYDYPNKPDYYYEGSADTPTMKIKVLPDGTEWYQINELDQWNNATNVISTYSFNGMVLTRANSYVYSTNGQDLLRSIRADGVTNASYGYNTNHQVLFMTNALGEVTSYLYNGYEQMISITQPNGQVTTNLYGSDGHLAEQIVVGISTNYYTWTNDLVYSHTDERGLIVTNSWDAVNRLTNALYPDGTSVSYIYSNLDLIQVIDRMGYTTSYTYDPIRERTSITDGNGHTTYYGYCQCGALYSITDALNNVTYFIHDDQGNLIQAFYPDGYSISNSYNLLRQLVSTTDSSGMTVNNWYNNQGLLAASSNNVGLVRSLVYDIDDRITNRTDANHVSVGMTYDYLDRLLTRSYPDYPNNGVEKYGYTPDISGPTRYTNQIGKIWLYGYDGVNRKTNEVCVGVTTNQFAFDGAGDLLTLTDGNGNPTAWSYDQYGRVTNKMDAAHNTIFKYGYDDDNRLTNRWTPAKGTTVYGYDPVGNLTGVTYATSPSISLSYDFDNRLTTMVDAIGTTAYTYDQVGQLLGEGGLWPDDAVNYTYQNRLRMALSLAHPDGTGWTEDYGYDDARRLIGVQSADGTFDYAYDPVKLQRVEGLGLPNGAYITNSYDSVARVLSTALISSNGVSLDSQNYVYNTAGQRTSETNTAGDYRTYSYDSEGELTKALAHEANGSTRLVDEAKYTYDAAGNVTSKEPGFNQFQTVYYTLNGLNEITNSLMGASVGFGWGISNAVSGSTTSPATNVLVNGLPATLYADNSFYAIPFSITNGPNTYKAMAWDINGNVSSNSSTVYAIPTNGFYAYDQNGNMLSDGYRDFAYDDENELIAVWVPNAWSNSFAYDGKMRRRIERNYSWNSGDWIETNEIHFVYDGNLVVEERNASNIPLVSYTRGNDLSGSLQGAGGIGGLLARTTYGQEVPGAPTTAFYHADGNGNITALIYPNQQIAAKYLYDPFGNMLAMSGPMANFNKYRFSSKQSDDNSGLYYYGYRFYDASLQRWLNRDPLGETGFESLRYSSITGRAPPFPQPSEILVYPDLYDFAANNPNFYADVLGLRFSWRGGASSGAWAALGAVLGFYEGYESDKRMDNCPEGTCNLSQCVACCNDAYAQGLDGLALGGISGGLADGWGIFATGTIALGGYSQLDSDHQACLNKCLNKYPNQYIPGQFPNGNSGW